MQNTKKEKNFYKTKKITKQTGKLKVWKALQ